MDRFKRIPVREQEPKVRATNFEEVCLGYNEEEAVAEASRCLNCPKPRCVGGCPVGINIPGFIAKVKERDFEGAAKEIAKYSALPAVCGRVCPQENQCEGQCVLGVKGEAVAIGKLERFVADWAREHKVDLSQKDAPKGKKVAIIGAGPAGLTCAGDLAKKGYEVKIFEALHKAGGVLEYGIPEFRLPKETVVASEVENIKKLGVEIETNVIIGKTITIDELFEDEGFDAVFIGSGAGLPKFMGIPGEQANGVFSANEFLTRVNLMKAFDESYDTPVSIGKKVAIIGGGNVAIDVARDSKRCASDDTKVNMFCLESRETMPASVEEIEEAESEGIVVNPGWGPKEVLVDENGEVRGVVLKKCLSVFDAEGRFNPTYDESELMTVECKHVFFSVGQSIVWGDLLKGSKVELGRGNGAVADALTYQTAEPDIFVGGDVYTGPKFAIDAIAAGKQGAISIHRFVQPQSSLTIGRNRNDFIELDKNDIKVENYDNSSRQIPGHNDAIDTKHSFRDVKLLFTEEQVKAETARCLGCGASVVDPNKCIGCGLCTTKCEFDAIKLHRELPECSRMVPYEDRLKFVLPNMVKQSIKLKFKKK